MRAVKCEAFGDPNTLSVGEMDQPKPGSGEVLVEVKAAAVSFMDRLMVEGRYQLKPPLPFSPGTDTAGIVSAVGEGVTSIAPGDRVVATAWFGGYAQYLCTTKDRVLPLPDGVSFAAASTTPYAYMTAMHALADRAALKEGETLLVTGAAGGAGLAAVDVGRHMGARIFAVARGEAKAAALKARGVEQVIDPEHQDLRETIKGLTDGAGVDVCYEGVGGDMFLTIARLMAFGGRLMPIGFAGGTIPALPMNLPLLKGYSVVGVFMGAWRDKFPSDARAQLANILDLTASGALQPEVADILPLSEAAAALQRVADRQVVGRIVLDPWL
ncbi:MAG: NADPH:quinone oxidoreductase family protein [Pseudomonadota bacterium]